ncbi:MAG: hypothetical protein IT314_03020 [Anaerolineales bacterium]|nr:hypothetical protein [Anaerolineales bacterium]
MNERKIYTKRIILSLVIGMLFGVAVTEIPIFLLYKTARAPEEIVLVIPKGTAEQVERGEQPPAIPQNMTFVAGDVLTVRNEDGVDHRLGEMWVPANSSASLSLDQPADLLFECSFQPDAVFGIDVRKPLTLTTHVLGIIGPGISLGIILALYSLALPIEKKEHASS